MSHQREARLGNARRHTVPQAEEVLAAAVIMRATADSLGETITFMVDMKQHEKADRNPLVLSTGVGVAEFFGYVLSISLSGLFILVSIGLCGVDGAALLLWARQ